MPMWKSLVSLSYVSYEEQTGSCLAERTRRTLEAQTLLSRGTTPLSESLQTTREFIILTR